MSFEIKIDDLSDGAVEALLRSHLEDMHNYSPVESIHALDSEKLKNPALTFWSVRMNNLVVGCGALKSLDSYSGEIKSMKTSADFLRQGVAEMLLLAIISEASDRQYTNLYLETGSHDAFTPAIRLYQKYGFRECGPYADYKLDPYSKFFSKTL